MARVVPLGVEAIEPGTEGFLQLRLERDEIYVKSGDPFILRSFSPMHTVGGGKILDARPKKHRRFKENLLTALRARDADLKEEVIAQFLQCCQSPFSTVEAISAGTDLPSAQVESALDHLKNQGLVKLFRLGWIHGEAFKSWQARSLSVSMSTIDGGPCASACPNRNGGSG